MAETISDYTTSDKVTRFMGSLGVSLRSDDDHTAMNEAITDASVDVFQYCGLRYTDTQLAASAWVEQKAKIIAAWHFCCRRLNPVPSNLQAMYEKIIEQLERVQAGQQRIADIRARKEDVPVLSNQGVTLRPFPRVVTVPSQSTGNPEGYTPHNDPRDIIDPGQLNGLN
jgi:phage gp36-like protein